MFLFKFLTEWVDFYRENSKQSLGSKLVINIIVENTRGLVIYELENPPKSNKHGFI